MMFLFLYLLWLHDIINALKAWNHNKNFCPDLDKNSLDVIGHTHTNRLCLSPIRHSGELCGPAYGASQSVHSPTFSLHRNVLQHSKSSLTDLQHSHRPVSSIYLLYEEELTLSKPESGISLWAGMKFLHCAISPAAFYPTCRINTGWGKYLKYICRGLIERRIQLTLIRQR